jgi:hypothetical protein
LFIKLYYRFHATGSCSEITAACLITQVHKILIEKSSIIHSMQSDDNEESCKQWFLTAVPCLCSIEAKSGLKPKQLFSGKYAKYLVINSDRLGLGSIKDTIVSCIVIHNFEVSNVMYHDTFLEVSCLFFCQKIQDTFIVNICTE